MEYNIEIKQSSIHGKGVFAKSKILKGTTFTYDVLPIFENNISDDLRDHIFPFNGRTKCICIGFPTFINHSQINNIKISKVNIFEQTKTFVSIVDIHKGEELTLYYSNGFNTKYANK